MFLFLSLSFLLGISPQTQIQDKQLYFKYLHFQGTHEERGEAIYKDTKDMIFNCDSYFSFHLQLAIIACHQADWIVSDIENTLVKKGERLRQIDVLLLIELIEKGKKIAFITQASTDTHRYFGFFDMITQTIQNQKKQDVCHYNFFISTYDYSFYYDKQKEGFVIWEQHSEILNRHYIRSLFFRAQGLLKASFRSLQRKIYFENIHMEEKVFDVTRIVYYRFDVFNEELNINEKRILLSTFIGDLKDAFQEWCLYDDLEICGLDIICHESRLDEEPFFTLYIVNMSKYRDFMVMSDLLDIRQQRVVYLGDYFEPTAMAIGDSGMLGRDNITCISSCIDVRQFWEKNSCTTRDVWYSSHPPACEAILGVLSPVLYPHQIGHLLLPIREGEWIDTETMWDILDESLGVSQANQMAPPSLLRHA